MESIPLVQEFRIEGLYGYRTVAMSATHSTTILIAKNGSGKTTLLGALDAFLRCQFGRLGKIEFTRIVCRLRGVDVDLELTASDIEKLLAVPDTPEFLLLARRYGTDPQSLLDFIENDFDASRPYPAYEDDEVFRKIVAKHDYKDREARRACGKVADSLIGRVPSIDFLRDQIRAVTQGIEVLYLPTYRRIELSLSDDVEPQLGRRRESVSSRLGLSKRGFFNTEIQFGLGDISEKLRQLNIELLAKSNQGYRQISAKIVNDLLDGTFEREIPSSSELPQREALSLFFSRIKHGGRMFAPHYSAIDIPDVDKIYGEGASSPSSSKFLSYFLAQLNEVIRASEAIEGRVEEFVRHCNEYLSSPDGSTDIEGESLADLRKKDPDAKLLKINRMDLQVSVVSLAAKKKIPINSLSSGEKQMISLFARLYLYSGPKIVLIDEPELSLSIDWQRRILLDVVKAPTCEQLIAITHSPFVFDNELDPYAKSLKLAAVPATYEEASGGDLFPDEMIPDE